MRIWDFSRGAFGICAAGAMLAGCGGSQPPIGAPLATSSGMTDATHAQGSEDSRTLPGSRGDLIYAVGGCGGTCVVSYPSGQFVGGLPTGGSGICSDSQGNVFITADYDVVEYAHGGSTPIATLSLPGDWADGCSVDPMTNNLAVVATGNDTDIAIFPNEGGSPRLYASNIDSFLCGYDNAGNLFVDGYADKSGPQPALAELPSGGAAFNQLTINHYIGRPGQVQWDGSYITYEATDTSIVKRLAISGSTATVVGETRLGRANRGRGASWIDGDRVVVPFPLHGAINNKIGIWKYPEGGKPASIIKQFGDYRGVQLYFQGVTISVTPRRGRPPGK